MSVNSDQLPGASAGATTRRREWWGWFGSIAWLFMMMYGYEPFMNPEWAYTGGSSYPFFFMLLFAVATAALGWLFGRNPNGLSKIAFFTTPAAILITAVFVLLPAPVGSILYVISPVLMAPGIVRRVYGVIHAAGEGRRLAWYMSGITVAVFLYTVWSVLVVPPTEIAFLVPALLSVPVWLGIRRTISVPDELPRKGALRFSKLSVAGLAGTLVVLFWLNTMSACIHTNIIAVGDETSQVIYTLLGFILPPVGFWLWGILVDKGHERTGFVCGMMLFLLGVVIALLPVETQAHFLIPLSIADAFGGSYTEFFILTIPVLFLVNTRRPVFAASLGLAVDLFITALFWEIEAWLPAEFLSLDTPVLAAAAMTAIVFVVLAHFLFEYRQGKTLAASLYSMLYSKDTIPAGETPPAELPEEAMKQAGFTQRESQIALLLMDGLSQYAVSRKLHVTSGEVGNHIKAMRAKVGGAGDNSQVIAAIVEQYGLTKREADMLPCLMRNMSNESIAAELFLSEETVRTHVRNLLKKLSVDSRPDVAAWVEAFSEKG